MRKLLFNFFLLSACMAFAAPDYYLAGECNGWEPNLPAYKFYQNDDIYTLTLDRLQGEFKITTSAWEHQYGAGTQEAGQALEPGITYRCVESGNGYNMTLADPSARDITLTFDNKNKTVKVSEGAVVLYLVGDFNNWQKSDSYRFEKSGDTYILRTSHFKGEFKVVSDDGAYSFGRTVNPNLTEGNEYGLDNNGGNLYFGGLSDPTRRLKFTLNPNGRENISAVGSITDDSETGQEVEYYTLQGVKVARPDRGVYIRRCGSSVQKVIIH